MPAVRTLPGSSPNVAQSIRGDQGGWHWPHVGSLGLQSLQRQNVMNLNLSIKGQFVSFAFALNRQREKEAGVRNVKIPSRGNGFQTWCHAAVMVFLHRKTQADHKRWGWGGQRQGQILFVWVSGEVFRFHSKQLHAWKINQRHLHRSSWVNAAG